MQIFDWKFVGMNYIWFDDIWYNSMNAIMCEPHIDEIYKRVICKKFFILYSGMCRLIKYIICDIITMDHVVERENEIGTRRKAAAKKKKMKTNK